MAETLTHEALVLIACRWLRSTKLCGLVYAEAGHNVCREEPDALGFRGGGDVCIVVECKVSRSDFAADKKKSVAQFIERMGSHRYYLVPDGLVAASEVPAGWGLLYANGRRVRLVVEAPLAENRSHMEERRWLYACTRRLHLGVAFATFRFDVTPDAKKLREIRAKAKAKLVTP